MYSNRKFKCGLIMNSLVTRHATDVCCQTILCDCYRRPHKCLAIGHSGLFYYQTVHDSERSGYISVCCFQALLFTWLDRSCLLWQATLKYPVNIRKSSCAIDSHIPSLYSSVRWWLQYIVIPSMRDEMMPYNTILLLMAASFWQTASPPYQWQICHNHVHENGNPSLRTI